MENGGVRRKEENNMKITHQYNCTASSPTLLKIENIIQLMPSVFRNEFSSIITRKEELRSYECLKSKFQNAANNLHKSADYLQRYINYCIWLREFDLTHELNKLLL